MELRQQDCNWMVTEAIVKRELLVNMLSLSFPGDIEAKTFLRTEVNKMTYNQVIAKISILQRNFKSDLKKCSELMAAFKC